MRLSRTACLALAALLLVGGAALAQASSNFDLSWHVIAGGGGRSASTAYSVQGTVGQAAAGPMSSGTYSLSGGFWLPQAGGPTPPQERLFLPLVLRGWNDT